MQTINAKGLALIEEFEGFSPKAYADPISGGEPWTIGYGHTLGVQENDSCTKAQALSWLHDDIEWAEHGVSTYVKVPLTSNQFSALVSFTFNLGLGRLRGSTLLTRLNAGDFRGAALEFLKWTSHGVAGLVRRRAAETALFTTPDAPRQPPDAVQLLNASDAQEKV